MRVLKFALKFVIVMVVMTTICTWAWDAFINGKVYDCTDGGSLDYLFVGDWVHHPVTVQHVVGGRPMSEPDTIRQGWTISRLWYLWFSFVGTSLVVSVLAASHQWISRIQRTVG